MSESRSSRTYTSTKGSGANKVTTTVVEETITKADGSKTTTRKETVTYGENGSTQAPAAGAVKSYSKTQPQNIPDVSGLTLIDRSPSTQFAQECLEEHNRYRKIHGVDPLTLAEDLNAYAQKWADHIAGLGRLQHSECGKVGLGENIAYYMHSNPEQIQKYKGKAATDQWYSEIKDYKDYNIDRMQKGTGHFTQVVWKGSKELGIGKAVKGDKVFVVASYRPPGNYAGRFKENVFPPQN